MTGITLSSQEILIERLYKYLGISAFLELKVYQGHGVGRDKSQMGKKYVRWW